MQVEIYSKPDCPLCDDAKAVLEEVRREIPFELIEVNIQQDPKLFEQFKLDVPVVYVDGRKAFKHRVDAQDLARRLERGRAFAMGTLDPRATLTRGRPVTRRTKIVFAAAVALGLSGVATQKALQKLVFDPELDARALEVEPQHFPAPPFTLQDDQGHTLSLSDYRGKVVLLNFWATWCPPCRDEMPSMVLLAKALGGRRDFAMLALSVDDGWGPVREFFGGRDPGFKVLLDIGARTSQAYGTQKYPESYVIDRKGNVVAKFQGPRDWDDPAALGYLKRLID